MDATPATNKRSDWAPRIWLGCDLFAALRLFWLGGYSFDLKLLRLLPLCTLCGLGHTFLRYAQAARYGRMIRATAITKAPIFILGHWRSGTTLLHELLVLDPRHTFPDTYHCFDPCHPLITERGMKKFFTWMLPPRRLMDNM